VGACVASLGFEMTGAVGLGKRTADAWSFPVIEATEEWIVAEFDLFEVAQPHVPVPCLLLVGAESDSFGGGNSSSQEVTSETIMGGRGEMAKVAGSCSGT
jgi:hypothetical protein